MNPVSLVPLSKLVGSHTRGSDRSQSETPCYVPAHGARLRDNRYSVGKSGRDIWPSCHSVTSLKRNPFWRSLWWRISDGFLPSLGRFYRRFLRIRWFLSLNICKTD